MDALQTRIVVEAAFLHFFHLDQANAHIHMAPVRFSPLTFRLAEVLREWHREGLVSMASELKCVLDHLGRYEEDKGR